MDRFCRSLAALNAEVCIRIHKQLGIVWDVRVLEQKHLLKGQVVSIRVAVHHEGARVLRLPHPGGWPGTLPLPRAGPNFSDHKCRRQKWSQTMPLGKVGPRCNAEQEQHALER